MVMAAVINNYIAFDYASNELKNDREMVMAVVQNNGYAFPYISDELQNDREIVMIAVQNMKVCETDAYILEFTSKELQKTNRR